MTNPSAHDLAILGRLLAEGFPALTDGQRAALEAFTAANGQKWRDALADKWLSDDDDEGPALRQVRNTYGPTWLFDVYAHGWLPDCPLWAPMTGELPGVKWSAAFNPPAVGDVVRVRINGLGLATVTGYFTEGGYLGVTVKLHAPQEWYVKQNGGNVVGHSFGAEIALVEPEPAPHPLADRHGYTLDHNRVGNVWSYTRPDGDQDDEEFPSEPDRMADALARLTALASGEPDPGPVKVTEDERCDLIDDGFKVRESEGRFYSFNADGLDFSPNAGHETEADAWAACLYHRGLDA